MENITSMEICFKFPPKINSPGIMEIIASHNKVDELLNYLGSTLLLQIALIFTLTQTLYYFLKRFGLPMLIAEIFAGIILGPSVLGKYSHAMFYSEDKVRILGVASGFGYLFFLFLNAVKMDLGTIKKVEKHALCMSLLSIFLPFLTGAFTASNLFKSHYPFEVLEKNKSFIFALLYSSSTFPVTHRFLNDLNILSSELGRLCLSTAMVSDIVTLVFVSLGIGILSRLAFQDQNVGLGVIHDVGFFILLTLILVFILRPLMKWIVRQTGNGTPVKDFYIYATIAALVLLPVIFAKFHLIFLVAPLFLGLAIPEGPPFGSAFVEKFEFVVEGVLLPLFNTTCAMRVDFSSLHFSSHYDKHQVLVSMVTILTKMVVSLVVSLNSTMPKRDSLAFTMIMNTKGILDLGFFSFFNDNKVVSDCSFAFFMAVLILMASVSAVLVKLIYDPSKKYASYRKRNIMHSKPNEELRLLACIHVPSNVSVIINLLDFLHPCSDTPLAVDVLHLVKLTARAVPIFISHEKHKKMITETPYSENVVRYFSQFERENHRSVDVTVFTAVSPPITMHGDICNAALERQASLIILPFHRQLSIDGVIQHEDNIIRSINRNILLETPPCSVGILVEGNRHFARNSAPRDQIPNLTIFSIAVIFMGGNDDREALSLAKRFSRDGQVQLTVIHLNADEDAGLTGEDEEMLREVRGSDRVTYLERQVSNGRETSSFLKSVVSEYNLIIVGRRYEVENPQTFGLKEWSEFSELGVLGDLLASTDFGGSYSLLIVQQQKVDRFD